MLETTSTTITGHSRPTSHSDLPDHIREGHTVATVVADYVVAYPTVGAHLLAALTAAEALGLDISDGQIRVPKTTAELDRHLEVQQHDWDHRKQEYVNALADPSPVAPEWRRGAVNRWAKAEGVREIEWATEVSA